MKCLPLLLPILACVVGCHSNSFREFYEPSEDAFVASFNRLPEKRVRLQPITSEKEVISAMEQGYIPIGTCTFVGPRKPWFLAVDVAEEQGADLVLLDVQYEKTEHYTSIIFLPSTQTSYTHGHYTGPRPFQQGNFSATTTSTTLNAIPYEASVDIFSQSALFLRRLDLSNFYGVIPYVPPRLPGESLKTPVDVTVLAVVRGSKAEKEGIKRGKRITAINGIPIRLRSDIEAFLENPNTISKVTVKGGTK